MSFVSYFFRCYGHRTCRFWWNWTFGSCHRRRNCVHLWQPWTGENRQVWFDRTGKEPWNYFQVSKDRLFLNRSCAIFSWLKFIVIFSWCYIKMTIKLCQQKIAQLRFKSKRTLSGNHFDFDWNSPSACSFFSKNMSNWQYE